MDAAQGARRYKPTLPRDFKSNRAATVHATVQPQRSSRSTTAPALQTLAFRDSHGALNFVFVRVCSVSQGDACNHDHLHSHVHFLKSNTRRISSCHTVYQGSAVREVGTPDDAPPFQLAIPPANPSQPHPEGEPCIVLQQRQHCCCSTTHTCTCISEGSHARKKHCTLVVSFRFVPPVILFG